MPNIREALDNEKSVLVSEPGAYPMVVENTEAHTSKTDGACVRVHGRTQDGLLIVATISTAPQAAFRLKQLVTACGKDPATIQDSDELVGCRVLAHIEKDTYRGEERLKVTRFSKLV